MSGLVCRRNVAGRELIEAMTTRYTAYGLALRCSFRLPGSIFVLARAIRFGHWRGTIIEY